MLRSRPLELRTVVTCIVLLAGCSSKDRTPEAAVQRCLAACQKENVDVIWSLAPRTAQQQLEQRAKEKGFSSGKEFLEKNKAVIAEAARELAEAKTVEQRTVPGATQFLLYPAGKNRALLATVIQEDGAWKTFLPSWQSVHYDGSARLFLVEYGRKGELDGSFLADLRGKPRGERERFVLLNKRKTITLTGTVKEVQPGNVVTGWFFYLEVPGADAGRKDGVEIQVGLDTYQFASSGCVADKGVKGFCTYFDGSTATIEAGQQITVTGIVWGCRADWFNGSLLDIESAMIHTDH